MTDVVVALLRNKYNEPEVIDDDTFFALCENIQHTYLDDSSDGEET